MGIVAALGVAMGITPVVDTPATAAAIHAAVVDSAEQALPPRLRRRIRGGAATRISSGFLDDLDPNKDLRGEKWYGTPHQIGSAGKMLRDPHIRASRSYVVDAICGGTAHFDSPTDEPRDKESAKLLNWAMFERLPWVETETGILESYIAYGFSLREVTDDVVPIPASRFPILAADNAGVAILPTGLHERPAWSVYRWKQAKAITSQLDGVQQWLPGSDQEPHGFPTIPSSRLLRHTWGQEGANYAGFAPLRSSYGAWKILKALEIMDAIKHERTGLGTPTLTLSEDADEEDIAAAELILAELRANEKGFVILPNGFALEWSGQGPGETSNLPEAMQRCKIDIAVNMISGLMMLGLGGPGASGSYALSNTQDGARHLHVDRHAKFFSEKINLGSDGWSIAERYVRINYGPDVSLPRLRIRHLPTRNWKAMVETTTKAVMAKLVTPDDQLEADVREALEWGPHDPSTAREQPVSLGTPPAEDEPDEEPVDDEDTEPEDEEMERAA